MACYILFLIVESVINRYAIDVTPFGFDVMASLFFVFQPTYQNKNNILSVFGLVFFSYKTLTTQQNHIIVRLLKDSLLGCEVICSSSVRKFISQVRFRYFLLQISLICLLWLVKMKVAIYVI